MSGKFLLDTNIMVALFAAEKSTQDRIALEKALYIPAIVLGELYYGAMKSSKIASNVARVDMVATWAILNCDKLTAMEFGRIKAALAAKGRPIPDNDMWSAAIALQHGLTLVTRDAHFSQIPNLAIENW